MPIDYKEYPKNWQQIRIEILKLSNGRCMCSGECGLHNGQDLFERNAHRCVERNGTKAKFAKGNVVLTIAHLCHNSMCENRKHLKALDQRCHLRYDVEYHKLNRRLSKEKNDERRKGAIKDFQANQIRLLGSPCILSKLPFKEKKGSG